MLEGLLQAMLFLRDFNTGGGDPLLHSGKFVRD
jgi:hypothetical protein